MKSLIHTQIPGLFLLFNQPKTSRSYSGILSLWLNSAIQKRIWPATYIVAPFCGSTDGLLSALDHICGESGVPLDEGEPSIAWHKNGSFKPSQNVSGLLSAAICESPLFRISPLFGCTNWRSPSLTSPVLLMHRMPVWVVRGP